MPQASRKSTDNSHNYSSQKKSRSTVNRHALPQESVSASFRKPGTPISYSSSEDDSRLRTAGLKLALHYGPVASSTPTRLAQEPQTRARSKSHSSDKKGAGLRVDTPKGTKSRSPRLPETEPIRSTPQFMPPSYYAAAAAMSPTSPSTVPATPKPPELEYPETGSSSSLSRRKSILCSPKSFLKSLPHSKPSSTRSSKAQSQSSNTSVEDTPSQRLGLSQMEKDLLPSMEDTVSRMTSTPRSRSSSIVTPVEAIDTMSNFSRRDSKRSTSDRSSLRRPRSLASLSIASTHASNSVFWSVGSSHGHESEPESKFEVAQQPSNHSLAYLNTESADSMYTLGHRQAADNYYQNCPSFTASKHQTRHKPHLAVVPSSNLDRSENLFTSISPTPWKDLDHPPTNGDPQGDYAIEASYSLDSEISKYSSRADNDSERLSLRRSIALSASQERSAFNIPASDSESGFSAGIPHTQSCSSLSSFEITHGPRDIPSLSSHARDLFQKLNITMDYDGEGVPKRERSGGKRVLSICNPDHLPSASSSSSVSSVYTQETSCTLPDTQSLMELCSASGILKHQPSATDIEKQRQKLLENFCDSEAAYVNSLGDLIRIFAQPLLSDGRAWVEGLPIEVTNLFDWLDDIRQLHTQFLIALNGVRSSIPHSSRVSGIIRQHIARFEVYQPYAVRCQSALDLIKQALDDHQNDFGEYMRLQIREEHCSEAELFSRIRLPLDRLVTYTKSFEDLRKLTPYQHVDYVATLSLVSTARLVFGVIQEVKERETLYESLKNMSRSIEGLPFSDLLARRDRKLIRQGNFKRLHLSDKQVLSLRIISDESKALNLNGNDASYSKSPKLFNKGIGRREMFEASEVRVSLFSDLILLTSRTDLGHDRWRPLPDIGVGKLLEFDLYETDIDANILAGLHIIPAQLHEVNDNDISLDTTIVTIYLDLSPSISDKDHGTSSEWVSVLRQCTKATQHSLISPQPPAKRNNMDPNTHSSVMSILASGLPMPKSPSLRMEEHIDSNRQTQEREERGWWTLRFYQVMSELRRREEVISEIPFRRSDSWIAM